MDSLTYTLEDQALMARAVHYFAWQAKVIVPELGQRVVEVGCGTGNFTRFLLDREVVVAVDIEAACVEALRERYPGQANLRTAISNPEDRDFRQLARFAPDSCVCLNVLEHIEDDLTALGSMAAILREGGVIALIVPAFPSLYGPIDRNLGHHRRYTRASLRQLAGRAGLKVRKIGYMNTVGFFGWWANARIFGKQSNSAAQIAFFDRWIVPVTSRVEAIVPPIFGQSLAAILVKE